MATRWGIASAGLISSDFVNAIWSLNAPQNHKVMAVAARKLEDAQTFSAKFDIPRAYGGYEALAKDSDIDVVYIGTINTTHLELVKIMIENGKNVLCEKPLGLNVKEVREMVELARHKKVFFMEAVWSRFQPAYKKLKEELGAKKAIGDVYHVQVDFGRCIKAERIAKKALGGGSMLDIGIYCLQLAQFVFDEEKPVKVVAAGHLNDDGCDESLSGTLIYSAKRSASFQTHSKIDTSCEAIIYGTKGSMKLLFPFWSTTKLQMPDGQIIEFPLADGKVPFNFYNSAGLAFEAEHVRECLKAGLTESPKFNLDQSLTIAELIEDIHKQVGVDYNQESA